MGKYTRLGLGIIAGALAGFAVYAIIAGRREKKRLVMPDVKAGNIIRFPTSRPPFAEAAEGAEEERAF